MEAPELLGKKTAYDVETTYHSEGAKAAHDLLRKEFTDLKDPAAVKAMVDKLTKDTSSSQILHALSLEEIEPKDDGTLVAGNDKDCTLVLATKDRLKGLAQTSATTGDEAFEKLMAQNILDQYDDLMGPAGPYNPKFGHDSRSQPGCNPDGVTQPDIDRLKDQYESVRTSTTPVPVDASDAPPPASAEAVPPVTTQANQGPELVGTNQTPNPGNQGPELVGANQTPNPGNQGPELVGANQTPNPGNQGPELVGAKPSPDNQGPELVGQEPEPTSKDVEVMAGAGYWDIAAASLGYTKGTPTKSIAELRAYVNSHTTQKDKTRIFYLMQQLQKDNHNKVLHPHEKLAVTEQEIEQSENH